MTNSIKRYPRSVIEAFPKTLEYGAAIEIPYREGKTRRYFYALLLALYAMIAVYVLA